MLLFEIIVKSYLLLTYAAIPHAHTLMTIFPVVLPGLNPKFREKQNATPSPATLTAVLQPVKCPAISLTY